MRRAWLGLATSLLIFGLGAVLLFPAEASQPDHVPGQLIVRGHVPNGYNVIATNQRLGASLVEVPDAAHDGLRRAPGVSLNHIFTLAIADARYGEQWAMPLIRADEAWEITTGSSTVTVGVIDTGIYPNHADLGEVTYGCNWYVQPACHEWFLAWDDHGHGTHVAGIIAAQHNTIGVRGLAPNVRLHAEKVCTNGGFCSSWAIAQGIIHAVDVGGAQIINMSLGGPVADQLVADAVAYAQSQGVLVIAAAGNTGNQIPQYPASFPGVISVSATDSTDSLASFSSYGVYVDVAAPGVSILSTVQKCGLDEFFRPLCDLPGTYVAWDGTSMATPHVVGLAALLLSLDPSLTPAQLTAKITGGAVDLGDVLQFGNGRIDVMGSLGSPQPTPEPTVEPTPSPTTEPKCPPGWARQGRC